MSYQTGLDHRFEVHNSKSRGILTDEKVKKLLVTEEEKLVGAASTNIMMHISKFGDFSEGSMLAMESMQVPRVTRGGLRIIEICRCFGLT